MKSHKGIWIAVSAPQLALAVLGALSDEQRERVWGVLGPAVAENWWWLLLLSTVAIAVWDLRFGFRGLPSKVRAKLSADYRASIELTGDIGAACHFDSWISRHHAHRWLTFQSKVVRSILRKSLSGSQVSKQVAVAKRKEIADRILWSFEQEQPKACKDRRYRRSTFFTWFEKCDWENDTWGWLRKKAGARLPGHGHSGTAALEPNVGTSREPVDSNT